MSNERSCSCGNYDNDAVFQNDRSGSCGCGETRGDEREVREAPRSSCGYHRCVCGCRSCERVGFLCCLNRLLGGEERERECRCCRRERRCGCGCHRERRSDCGCRR